MEYALNEHDRARLYFLQMDLLGSVRHLTFYFSSDGRNIISAMATKNARNISNCRLRDEFNFAKLIADVSLAYGVAANYTVPVRLYVCHPRPEAYLQKLL